MNGDSHRYLNRNQHQSEMNDRDSFNQNTSFMERQYTQRNGANSDIDVAARYGSGAVKFELDHLATFTAPSNQSTLDPSEGLNYLKQMENTTGVWTMRCTLVLISGQAAIIIDRDNGEEMERFPVNLIKNPTCVQNADRREMYNNIVMFTVTSDSKKRTSSSEMHIFQSISVSAHDIIDDINRAKNAQPLKRSHAAAPLGLSQAPKNNGTQLPKPLTTPHRDYRDEDDSDTFTSTNTEFEVIVLNQCFDDIEEFVGRLNIAVLAYRELKLRREQRRKKDIKNGDGILTMRSKLPPLEDFVNILKKFKLCFNLLATLQEYIHNPNSPELVRFLFKPMKLVVDASCDCVNGQPDLAQRVVSPLLSAGAVDLLKHCLNSREHDLWKMLGTAWTTAKPNWTGFIPPFQPHFNHLPPGCDVVWAADAAGQPAQSESTAAISAAVMAQAEFVRRREEMEREREREERRVAPHRQLADSRTNEYSAVSPSLSHEDRRADGLLKGVDWEDQQLQFTREVRSRRGRLCQCTHDIASRNPKELTVRKGELLEIIDDSRNWWKLRNHLGEVGHCPYTLLRNYDPTEHEVPSSNAAKHQLNGMSMSSNALIIPPAPPTPPQPTSTEPFNMRRGKKDEKKEEKKRLSLIPNYSEELTNELKARVSVLAPVSSTSNSSETSLKELSEMPKERFPVKRNSTGVYLNKESSAAKVQEWLIAKGFTDRTQSILSNKNAQQLFELPRNHLDTLIGRDEATKLESLLLVQKNLSGYGTLGGSELKRILRARREQADHLDEDDVGNPNLPDSHSNELLKSSMNANTSISNANQVTDLDFTSHITDDHSSSGAWSIISSNDSGDIRSRILQDFQAYF